jgi:hypothetical protein
MCEAEGVSLNRNNPVQALASRLPGRYKALCVEETPGDFSECQCSESPQVAVAPFCYL